MQLSAKFECSYMSTSVPCCSVLYVFLLLLQQNKMNEWLKIMLIKGHRSNHRLGLLMQTADEDRCGMICLTWWENWLQMLIYHSSLPHQRPGYDHQAATCRFYTAHHSVYCKVIIITNLFLVLSHHFLITCNTWKFHRCWWYCWP